MRKVNWQTTIEVVGVTAVVVSLLLVVMEIRQNNNLMEAEARYNRLQASLQPNYIVAESSGISLAKVLLTPRSELEPEEQLVQSVMWHNTFRIDEWSFRELPRDELPLEDWRRVMTLPGAQETWDERSNTYDIEFALWFRENVIDQIQN